MASLPVRPDRSVDAKLAEWSEFTANMVRHLFPAAHMLIVRVCDVDNQGYQFSAAVSLDHTALVSITPHIPSPPPDIPPLEDVEVNILRSLLDRPLAAKVIHKNVNIKYYAARRMLVVLARLGLVKGNRVNGYDITQLGRASLKAKATG